LYFTLPLSLFAARGDLIDFSKKAHVTRDEHKSLCTAFSISCELPTSCDIYTFSYETIGLNYQVATASGVFILPESSSKTDLLVYLHGTVADKDEAPSKLGYHTQLPLSVFAQNNYNIVIPDYLGIGLSTLLFHPFCHAETLASASYDATLAALKLCAKLKQETMTTLYITGYSEGGMAALSLHKYLEDHPIKDLNFKASCPMSGPYDLSSSLSFALNSTSPRMNTYISYVISSYNKIYPDVIPSFNKVFTPEVSYLIPLLFDGCHPFWTINNILTKMTSLLNPDYIKAFSHQNSPFFLKLKENDTYTFAPKERIHFIGLEKDSEVAYFNSVKAYQTMKKLKCPVSLENASSELDHMQGSPLCHVRALKFFQSLR